MYYYKANAWRQVFVEIEAIACDLAQRKRVASANYADGSSRFLCARHGGRWAWGWESCSSSWISRISSDKEVIGRVATLFSRLNLIEKCPSSARSSAPPPSAREKRTRRRRYSRSTRTLSSKRRLRRALRQRMLRSRAILRRQRRRSLDLLRAVRLLE